MNVVIINFIDFIANLSPFLREIDLKSERQRESEMWVVSPRRRNYLLINDVPSEFIAVRIMRSRVT